MPLTFPPFCAAGHQQSECPKKAVDVYRLPDQLQSRVDEMYAKVGLKKMAASLVCMLHSGGRGLRLHECALQAG